MKRNRSFPALIFVVVLGIGAALAYAMHRASADFAAIGILAVSFVLACAISSAIQVADQWSKAVVLDVYKRQEGVQWPNERKPIFFMQY